MLPFEFGVKLAVIFPESKVRVPDVEKGFVPFRPLKS